MSFYIYLFIGFISIMFITILAMIIMLEIEDRRDKRREFEDDGFWADDFDIRKK